MIILDDYTGPAFQAVIQWDDGDEVGVTSSFESPDREACVTWATQWLRNDRDEPDEFTYTAFIYTGKMVDHGDDDWTDIVFEVDATVYAQVLRGTDVS